MTPRPNEPASQRPEFLAARRQVFEAAFVGYGAYYLVRTNLAPVSTAWSAAFGLSKADYGTLVGVAAFSYGAGKLLLGTIADRNSARVVMPLGLVLSALCNVAFAFAPAYAWHLGLWALNNFVQGMGWGPCGRVIAHWFGASERGRAFGIWNVSHNLGGALVGPIATYAATMWGWRAAFLVPAALSLAVAADLARNLRDTPESMGLEGPKDDAAPAEEPRHDLPVSALWRQVLGNPWMWLLALANFFAYVIRYSLLDWGPTYLKEARGASLVQGGWSTFAYELAGVASTIGIGWLTDRLGGRRALIGLFCVVPIFLALLMLVYAPASWIVTSVLAFAIVGFCIYPLLMLFTVIGLDLTSKKAIGTAAGFIGLFGYLGKAAQGKALGWLAQSYSWNIAIGSILGVLVAEVLLLLLLWRRAESVARAEVATT